MHFCVFTRSVMLVIDVVLCIWLFGGDIVVLCA